MMNRQYRDPRNEDWTLIEACVRCVVRLSVPCQERDDVVQASLMKLFVHLLQHEVRDVLQYAVRVARTRCLDFRQAAERATATIPMEGIEGIAAPCHEMAPDCSEGRIEQATATDVLAWFDELEVELTERQRQLLEAMQPGMSQRELARKLDVDHKRVDQLVQAVGAKARFLGECLSRPRC